MSFPTHAQTVIHNQGRTDPPSQNQNQQQQEVNPIAKERIYQALRETYKPPPQEHQGLYTVDKEALHPSSLPMHKSPSPFDVDDDETPSDEVKVSVQGNIPNMIDSPSKSTKKHSGGRPSQPNENVSLIPTSAGSPIKQQQNQQVNDRHPQIQSTRGTNNGLSNNYHSTPSIATQRLGEPPEFGAQPADTAGESHTLRRNDTYVSQGLDNPSHHTQATNNNGLVGSAAPVKRFQTLMKGSSGSFGSGSIDSFEGSGVVRSTIGGHTRLVRRSQGQHSSGPIAQDEDPSGTQDDNHQAYDNFGQRLGEKRKWNNVADEPSHADHAENDEELHDRDRSDDTLFGNDNCDNGEHYDHHHVSKHVAHEDNTHKSQDEQEIKDDIDSAEEFDPMAEIIKFDAQCELVGHWRGYTGKVSPFLTNFAQETLCSAYDAILSVTRLYHSLSADDKRDLEEGVELIDVEEGKHEEYRQVITNFSNEMKHAAEVLSRFNLPRGN